MKLDPAEEMRQLAAAYNWLAGCPHEQRYLRVGPTPPSKKGYVWHKFCTCCGKQLAKGDESEMMALGLPVEDHREVEDTSEQGDFGFDSRPLDDQKPVLELMKETRNV